MVGRPKDFQIEPYTLKNGLVKWKISGTIDHKKIRRCCGTREAAERAFAFLARNHPSADLDWLLEEFVRVYDPEIIERDIAEAIDEFEAELPKQLNEGYVTGVMRKLRFLANPTKPTAPGWYLGKQVSEITGNDLVGKYKKLVAANNTWKPKTRNDYRDVFHLFFYWSKLNRYASQIKLIVNYMRLIKARLA